MGAAEWIALGSAVVALLAGGFAFWQALSARRQAAATEQQVSLMQRQIDAEMTARDEAAGPTFKVENAVIFYDGQRFATASLTMTSGTPLSLVKVRVRGAEVEGLVPFSGSHDRLDEKEFTHLSEGGRIEITAMMDYNAATPANLTVDLECFEEGERQRKWIRSCTASATERPEVMGTWR
ncbi:hypothetical protein [Actinocrispum sp. NPDC049592]|uniref:hypothetical protein n=1 Tax=Actinocrispum sp. NPDC049592 TaxID=3154835 RepID=UPI003416C57F